jgi:hypothetical protein
MVTYLEKFCKNLVNLTRPLRDILKKDAAYIWDNQQKQAMANLKSNISSLPVLRLFEISQPVVVSVDASQFGIGAVLMQEGQPVAFSSTTLTVTQKRYCQIEKELLAVQYTNSVLLWSPIINRWLVCWTSLLLRARRGFNECGFNCNGLTSS